MRRFRSALLVSLALLAAACGRLVDDGGGAGSGGIEHPTGASDLVLKVDMGGGFVMPQYALTRTPQFALYGDGLLVTTGPQIEIYPSPALPPLLASRLTGSGIQKVLEAARDAGLFQDATYDDFCGVADVGTTTFTVTAEGATHVVSAYALGFDGCADDPAAREALVAFSSKLMDLSWLDSEMDVVGPTGPYAYASIAIVVEPYAPFDDPTLPQEEVAWPLATSLATFGDTVMGLDFRCGVLTGADVETLRPLFESTNQMTPWTSDGERWKLGLRPLLPDETACPAF